MKIESSRILLRKFKRRDFSDFLEIYTDKEIFKYELSNPLEKGDIEYEFNEILASYMYEAFDHLCLAIEEKESKKMIGTITLDYKDPDQKICEIGGWLKTEYTKKGYATEIGKELIQSLLYDKNCSKVFCSTVSQNKNACRLIERLGLEQEGLIKMGTWANGKNYDIAFYGILKSDL